MNAQYTTKKYSKWTNTREYIIVHHTASNLSSPDVNVVKYLANSPAEVSCHYVVGRDWEVYILASDDKITRHAGQSVWNGRANMNRFSIGIEVISDWYSFTEQQKEATKLLIQDLLKKYNLPVTNVLRHADIAPKRKRDIGEKFYEPMTWVQYQDSLKQSFSEYELSKAKSALHGNSELWEATSNQELKKQLNLTNNMIRSYYSVS